MTEGEKKMLYVSIYFLFCEKSKPKFSWESTQAIFFSLLLILRSAWNSKSHIYPKRSKIICAEPSPLRK